MIEKTVHLSFELSAACNLSKEHAWCPAHIRKGGTLGAYEIVRAIDEAVSVGFRGYVGFHYYNEPLLHFPVIEQVVRRSTYDKFMLWTNGLLLEAKHVPFFRWIVVTNYPADTGIDITPKIEALRREFRETSFRIIPDHHDTRLRIYENESYFGMVQCFRPFIEIPIDCEGNVHLCCQDWKGEVKLGNIRERSLADILTSGKYVGIVEGLVHGADQAPLVCRRCVHTVAEEVYRSYADRAGRE